MRRAAYGERAARRQSTGQLSRQEFAVLAKLYGEEIERALGPKYFSHMPLQIKSKYLESLEAKGMIEKREITLPGQFPVVIKGWELTLLGNATYCLSCK